VTDFLDTLSMAIRRVTYQTGTVKFRSLSGAAAFRRKSGKNRPRSVSWPIELVFRKLTLHSFRIGPWSQPEIIHNPRIPPDRREPAQLRGWVPAIYARG
jgi:hypothetical protein